MDDLLKGKKLLIEDDEPDILETLKDILDTCIVDSAPDFETARKFLENETYDVAILDIMGVDGYDLLELSQGKGIPTIMLTAHALSSGHLIKSLKGGAQSYVPKEKMHDIETFVADLLQEDTEDNSGKKNWFAKLMPYFNKKFGADWKEKDKFFKEFEEELKKSIED